MVFVDTEAVGLPAATLLDRLAGLGVGAVPIGPAAIRMVTHVGVDDDGIAHRDRRVAIRRRRHREGAMMGLFSKEYPPEVAARVPPGNRLVKTWPVLHYGPIPTFDGTNWDLEVSGLVANPFTLTYEELRALPSVTVDADMHCVTGLDDARQHLGGRPVPDAPRAGAAGGRRRGG